MPADRAAPASRSAESATAPADGRDGDRAESAESTEAAGGRAKAKATRASWWPPRAKRTKKRLPGLADCGTALRRTPLSIWNDDVTDWAAALTYYAVLALLPALLVTVSALGLEGRAATETLIRHVVAVLPAQSGDLMGRVLRDMAARDQRSTAWLLAGFGTVGALWFASSYLSVFRRALHSLLGMKDHRPVWRTVPRTVVTAVSLLALLISSVFVLILSGELARRVGGFLGIGEIASGAWETLKWPLLLCLVAVLVLLLFRSGPRELRGLHNGSPGGALAVLLWLVASAGFALYASHVGTYHRLYGSLAGIVVFLVWLWMSNLALLCGAQFNAELAKLRQAHEACDPEPEKEPEPQTEGAEAGPGATTKAEADMEQTRPAPGAAESAREPDGASGTAGGTERPGTDSGNG